MQRLVQLIAGMLLAFSTAAGATELTDLGEQFWRWRAETQPISWWRWDAKSWPEH